MRGAAFFDAERVVPLAFAPGVFVVDARAPDRFGADFFAAADRVVVAAFRAGAFLAVALRAPAFFGAARVVAFFAVPVFFAAAGARAAPAFFAVDVLLVDVRAPAFVAAPRAAAFFFAVEPRAARAGPPDAPRRAPPSWRFTVAQAMRSAVCSGTPRASSLSSMCAAWRFCRLEYDDLSPRGMAVSSTAARDASRPGVPAARCTS